MAEIRRGIIRWELLGTGLEVHKHRGDSWYLKGADPEECRRLADAGVMTGNTIPSWTVFSTRAAAVSAVTEVLGIERPRLRRAWSYWLRASDGTTVRVLGGGAAHVWLLVPGVVPSRYATMIGRRYRSLRALCEAASALEA